jgi:glycosyltransferase involved in cell wall biosynthesis
VKVTGASASPRRPRPLPGMTLGSHPAPPAPQADAPDGAATAPEDGGGAAVPGRRAPWAASAVRPRIVLVMPEFNEARTIVGVLREAAPFVDRIVVVDDGSHDDSHARTLAWMDTAAMHVDLLRHDRNRGMSGALLSGFAHVYALLLEGLLSPEDVIVNIDADGQHDPAEIPALVERLLQGGADVVLGRRDLRGYPLYKRIGNWGLSLSGSLLAGCRYHDIECGFRAMRVRTVAALLAHFSGHRYGCAQEIGVILPRCGFVVDNTLGVRVRYYREGARFRDGAVNAAMGLLACLRVVLRIRAPLAARAAAVLESLSTSSSAAAAAR